ncbi:unnamed protein product [Cladocopium goreaui]|uniref:Ankyrin repeat domain-containing protein 50 n=1 Tax=Cladocopium goreaui TaxID=2562237 RepID=A0A9P1FJZ0_9DINO|nr:unnamed protein product [Cladocopium goreaui]
MDVRVWSIFSGELLSRIALEAGPGVTGADIKKILSDQLGINRFRQVLYSKDGTQILNGEVLNQIEHDVHLLVKGTGHVSCNESQRSQMVEASAANKLQILELLLYEHLDPNTTDAYGRTLLELAAGGDHLDVGNLLLEAGAEAETKSAISTPLLTATRMGNTEFVNLLLQANANPNRCYCVRPGFQKCWTPLICAVRHDVDYDYRHATIVPMLIQAGADVNYSCDSMPPLVAAVEQSSYHIMWYLLQAQANPNVTNRNLKPVLHIAVKRNDPTAVEMLLQNSADIELRDAQNRSAEQLAASGALREMQAFEMLIRGYKRTFRDFSTAENKARKRRDCNAWSNHMDDINSDDNRSEEDWKSDNPEEDLQQIRAKHYMTDELASRWYRMMLKTVELLTDDCLAVLPSYFGGPRQARLSREIELTSVVQKLQDLSSDIVDMCNDKLLSKKQSEALTENILNEIPMLGQQVFDMKLDEERKVNPHNPAKTVQISNNRVVYYESFHLLINRYTYNKNHGISFHDDIKEGYDVDKDPITSFSCRLGSLLVIISSTAPEKQEKTEGKRAFVVYQPPGTILVMGGKFQRAYKHGVPSFQEIKELLACADDLTTWDGVKLKLEWFSNSKDLMRQEVRRIDALNLVNEQDARWNVTMRWVRNHSQPFCPLNPRLLANISRLDEENHQRRNQLKQLKLLNPVLQKKTAEPKAKAASPAFAWNPPGGNRARPSKSGTQDVNPGRETEEKESEKDSEKVSDLPSSSSSTTDGPQWTVPTSKPAGGLQRPVLREQETFIDKLRDDGWNQDLFAMSAPTLEKFELELRDMLGDLYEITTSVQRSALKLKQYNLGYNLYNKISAANMKVKEDLDPLLEAVDRKLRRLKNLQMLIELLWLDSEGQGNFMSCTTLNQQHEFNKSNDHLNRVVMSFFDLNECLPVDGFLGWDHMIDEGWLVFNFDTLQDNRKPKAEVTKSKKGSPVVADVTMS